MQQFAVSQIEDCLELNFRYVDISTPSSCVYWISAGSKRAQHFLSVRESISASTVIISLQGTISFKAHTVYLIHQANHSVSDYFWTITSQNILIWSSESSLIIIRSYELVLIVVATPRASLTSHTLHREEGCGTLQLSCNHGRNLMWPIRYVLFIDCIRGHWVAIRHVFSRC